MSAIVFAGSAQIAALAILGAGGGLASALGAAALMNSRFLPIGIAFAPSLPGRPASSRARRDRPSSTSRWSSRRTAKAAYDRGLLFGSSAIQYTTWVAGRRPGRSWAR